MSSSTITPVQALDRARRLTSAAVNPRSTAQERRKFHEYLITLPSYPGYECKAYFGTLVARFFAEFEDLQDKAVDVLLDLCEDEDEKTRMIGIKGLGATGKAAPRWVKGNTGVLLQLLETPPKELELVHQAVGTLLYVQPSEVLTVMSEVCRDPEEETGASRRKILEYLHKEASMFRQQVLESGKDLEAERVFREGFNKVLKVTGTTETKMLLEMMMGLTSISGKNATEKSAGGYILSLIQSLPRDSSTSSTLPLLRMFTDFVDSDPPLDPRYPLLLMEHHGLAVLGLAMEKQDKLAKRLIDRLVRWTKQAMGRWTGKGRGDEDSKELGEGALVPELSKVLLEGVLTQNRDGSVHDTLGPAASTVEATLYCFYSLMHLKDRRRDLVSSKQSRSLANLRQDADRAERRAKTGMREQRVLQNIRDLTELLGDYHLPLKRIVPSWEAASTFAKPVAVSPPRRTESSRLSLPTHSSGPGSNIPSEPSRDRSIREKDALMSNENREPDNAAAKTERSDSKRIDPKARPASSPLLPQIKPPSPTKPPPTFLSIRRQEQSHVTPDQLQLSPRAPPPSLLEFKPPSPVKPPPISLSIRRQEPAHFNDQLDLSARVSNPSLPGFKPPSPSKPPPVYLPIRRQEPPHLTADQPTLSARVSSNAIFSPQARSVDTSSTAPLSFITQKPVKPAMSINGSHSGDPLPPGLGSDVGKELLSSTRLASQQAATELLPTKIPASGPAKEQNLTRIPASASLGPSPARPMSIRPLSAVSSQELLPFGLTTTAFAEHSELNKTAVLQQTWSQQVATSSRSLADRLGAASSPDAPTQTFKRPRMEESPRTPAASLDLSHRPSLLDRLSSRDGVPELKKPKLHPAEAHPVPRSLLSRLSGQEAPSASPDQISPRPRPSESNTPTASIDILFASRRSIPTNTESLTDRPTLSAVDTPSSSPGPFGIRGASGTNGVSIKGQAPAIASREPVIDDGQIKRKGRGFRRDEGRDAAMTALPSPLVVTHDHEPPFLMRRISSKSGPRR